MRDQCFAHGNNLENGICIKCMKYHQYDPYLKCTDEVALKQYRDAWKSYSKQFGLFVDIQIPYKTAHKIIKRKKEAFKFGTRNKQGAWVHPGWKKVILIKIIRKIYRIFNHAREISRSR